MEEQDAPHNSDPPRDSGTQVTRITPEGISHYKRGIVGTQQHLQCELAGHACRCWAWARSYRRPSLLYYTTTTTTTATNVTTTTTTTTTTIITLLLYITFPLPLLRCCRCCYCTVLYSTDTSLLLYNGAMCFLVYSLHFLKQDNK